MKEANENCFENNSPWTVFVLLFVRGYLTSERQVKNRMDGRDVEPSSRLHENQPRLPALLCGNFRRKVSRRAWASL